MNHNLPRLILRLALVLLIIAAAAAQSALAQRAGTSNRSGANNRSRSSGSSSAATSSTDGGRTMGTAVIQYDTDTGSIMVITDDETNAEIEKVIQNLDQPVPQVLIKVLFLEVTHTDNLDLGVEASIRSSGGTQYNELASVFGLASETQGGFYRILKDDLDATLRAIAETNKLEVLSRPSVLTRNNQQASITVGQEVPFITNSRVTDEGQVINTIEYSDVGIILQVTPHIAPGRMVEMRVLPEISTLTAETVPISETVNARVVAKRSAETRVLVGDGKTVVIGGMMENNLTDQVRKVPLLGDIPWIGGLFRRTVKANSKTELLIFLTPLVVDNPLQLEQVSDSEHANTRLAPQAFSPEELGKFMNTPGPVTTHEPDAPGIPGAPDAPTEIRPEIPPALGDAR